MYWSKVLESSSLSVEAVKMEPEESEFCGRLKEELLQLAAFFKFFIRKQNVPAACIQEDIWTPDLVKVFSSATWCFWFF